MVGSMRCSLAKVVWRNYCPKKINIFNCLVWQNKIPSFENLELRRCNRLPIATLCVMCHSGIQFVDHLFLACPFAKQVWGYFMYLLQLPDPPLPLSDLWSF